MDSKMSAYEELKERLDRIHLRSKSAASGFGTLIQESTAELAGIISTLQEDVQHSIDTRQSVYELSEKLRSMAERLTIAEQKERQRVARILHDNLQQFLAAAAFHVSDLQQSPAREIQHSASAIDALLKKAIQVTRSLSSELYPPMLHSVGLAQALKWLGDWMQDTHRLRVELACRDEVALKKEELKVFLFESVRELLFNVVKHAGTDTAFVQVAKAGSKVSIEVSDRGCGFDPSVLGKISPWGQGLVSIRERLSLLGGSLDVVSAPNCGSKFTLTVVEH